MIKHYYFGKVADEPNEWVLGTLEREDDNYAYIFHRREDYPFSKCCGWGVFAVHKNSLRKTFLIELEKNENDIRNEV